MRRKEKIWSGQGLESKVEWPPGSFCSAVIAALLCLAMSLAWAGPVGAKDAKVRRLSLETAAGQAFSIELPLGNSKGYSWSLDGPVDPRNLELTGAKFVGPGPGEKGLGSEIWSFRALEPGLGELRFAFRSSYSADRRQAFIRIYQVYIWDLAPLRRPAPGHGPDGEPDQDPEP